MLAGVFLGSQLVTFPLLMLALPAVIGVLTSLVLAAVIRNADRPLATSWPSFGIRELLGSYRLRTGGDRDFAWNWVSRLLIGVAYVACRPSRCSSSPTPPASAPRRRPGSTPGLPRSPHRCRSSASYCPGICPTDSGAARRSSSWVRYPVFFAVLSVLALLSGAAMLFVRRVR